MAQSKMCLIIQIRFEIRNLNPKLQHRRLLSWKI